MSEEFTHLDESDEARMVDVGDKAETHRVAIAEALVVLSEATRDRLFAGNLPKGDAAAAARIAGIMAAKRTSDLIPLCHPLRLSHAEIKINADPRGARVTARIETVDRTGVEMEAMVAVSTAALTIYDMVKGVEREANVASIRLLHKSGGKSGDWSA